MNLSVCCFIFPFNSYPFMINLRPLMSRSHSAIDNSPNLPFYFLIIPCGFFFFQIYFDFAFNLLYDKFWIFVHFKENVCQNSNCTFLPISSALLVRWLTPKCICLIQPSCLSLGGVSKPREQTKGEGFFQMTTILNNS